MRRPAAIAGAAAVLAVAALPAPTSAQSRARPTQPSGAAPAVDPNTPVRTAEDANMRVVPYSPGARVRLVGTVGTSVVLTFASDEQIKRVVFGDGGETWEGPDGEEIKQVPLNNHLNLWPKKPGYTTLQVVTRRGDGTDRPYQFALVAREPKPACRAAVEPAVCDDPEATYGLRFGYPDDERAAKAAEAAERSRRWRDEAPLRAQRQAHAQLVAARDRLEVDFFAGGACRNWRYEAEGNAAGKAALVPDDVADNGQETAFRFKGGREVPAFFIPAANGKDEQPIRPNHRGGDAAVLPLVAPEIRLRLGDAVLHVYNRDPDRGRKVAECEPGTGTTSPDVVRGLRRAPPPSVAAGAAR